MKSIVNKQHGGPSNSPTDGNAFTKMLEVMTEEELTDGLNEALENMTEENYDSTLIDAYLAALDQKAPIPEVPDTDISFANFKDRLLLTFPAQNDRTAISRHRVRFVWRIGLIAAITVICLMGGMVVAQASGIDVFGAMARWTKDVFSFGQIPSYSVVSENPDGETEKKGPETPVQEFSSLQEALDAYGVTEVKEPGWLPDGYAVSEVGAEYSDDPYMENFYVVYTYNGDGSNCIQLAILRYEGEPVMQVERTDTPVEMVERYGITFYLIENMIGSTIAWHTDQYEYYISAKADNEILWKIAESMFG